MGSVTLFVVPSSSGVCEESFHVPPSKSVFSCKPKPADGEGHEMIMLRLVRRIDREGRVGRLSGKEVNPFTSNGGRPGWPFSTAAWAIKRMTLDLPTAPFVEAISNVLPSEAFHERTCTYIASPAEANGTSTAPERM